MVSLPFMSKQLLPPPSKLSASTQPICCISVAISDKHPRTAVGYTANNELILFVCEGRFKGRADGLTLTEMAKLMQQIGCVEALNLDGGGSSCLLVNGKETIKPSDKEGQRPVPAVFMIR